MKEGAPDASVAPDLASSGFTPPRSSLSSSNNPPPPAVPDHELVKRIGAGSYGEVWLARTVLGDWRAVKIVHRSTFEDDRPFQREFEGIRRFEPISRSHPSQLNILHVGRGDGCFYYVMELADDGNDRSDGVVESWSNAQTPTPQHSNTPILQHPGYYTPRTLKLELKRRGRLPPAECVEIGLALTTALGHLHGHGLVHRDIKPSNIIFVGGVPKLADIGLVTDVDATRSFVGTEGFLPPEGPGTPQADLYSLGKVLYEMSTGRDRKDYPALSQDWDTLDAAGQARLLELNEVLVKSCEADLRRRYQTAEQMHDDLALLRRGISVRRKRIIDWRIAVGKKISLAVAALAILAVTGSLLSPILTLKIENTGMTNAEALRLYRLGRHHWNRRTGEDLTRAVAYFQEAIALDSNYARAYAGLADAYNLMAEYGSGLPKETKPKARDAALRAIALDGTLAEAHTSLAKFKTEYEWDWSGAEHEFKKAIALDPEYATAHQWYSLYLTAVGRTEEAITEGKKSLSLDPTSLIINTALALQFRLARRYDEAIEQARRTVDLDPNFSLSHWNLARLYELQGNHEAALAENLRKISSGDRIATLKEAYALSGMKGYWMKELEWKQEQSNTGHVSPMAMAEICAHLGDKNSTLDWLEQAVEERSPQMTYHIADACYDSVRSEPRFRTLLQKMGLEKFADRQ